MAQLKRLREPEWKAPCLTETCENLSGHASGLCPDCRSQPCSRCGNPIVKQSINAKNSRCVNCLRTKESDQKPVRLKD